MHDAKRSNPERAWSIRGYTVWQVNRPFKPPTDVIELPDRVLVLVEIAGMRAHQIEVAIAGRELVISGERERPALNATGYHQMEVGYGEFRVDVTLPFPVDRDAVTAVYRDGFLHVELPRQPDAQHFIIEVITEEQDSDER
jgi:HSP20 family protein